MRYWAFVLIKMQVVTAAEQNSACGDHFSVEHGVLCHFTMKRTTVAISPIEHRVQRKSVDLKYVYPKCESSRIYNLSTA